MYGKCSLKIGTVYSSIFRHANQTYVVVGKEMGLAACLYILLWINSKKEIKMEKIEKKEEKNF